MLRRYMEAVERADVAAVADLLAEDVRTTMPPYRVWFLGRDAVGPGFLAGHPHQPGDQKYVDEKLDARLNQKVFPEQMRGAVDQGEYGNRQDNRRDDAE